MENKEKLIGIIFLLLILVLSGCVFRKQPETKNTDEKVLEVEKETKQIFRSPLSGLEIDEINKDKRPISIMIDNHNRARWQSGLQAAELVYEYRVEGTYTRYLAFYLRNIPEKIGPVRSARPYFVNKALEMDSVYVHVGGSVEAKNDIRRLGIADIDGLSSNKKVFWRESHKKAPNNLYTDLQVLKEEQVKKGYREETNRDYFLFNIEDESIEGKICNEIIIKYLNPNTTKYEYDEKEKEYIRYKDGQLHLEELDNNPIRVKNIIIQELKTRVIDNEGRLSIQTIGEGIGKYITNGKIIDVLWTKGSESDITIYKDLNGIEIKLNPGNTWVQVVDEKSKIEILSEES